MMAWLLDDRGKKARGETRGREMKLSERWRRDRRKRFGRLREEMLKAKGGDCRMRVTFYHCGAREGSLELKQDKLVSRDFHFGKSKNCEIPVPSNVSIPFERGLCLVHR